MAAFTKTKGQNPFCPIFRLAESFQPETLVKAYFFKNTRQGVAFTKLAKWYNDVTDSGFKSFNTITATIYKNYREILNFFDNRSTNTSAVSFNAKIKAFRSQLRGVRDVNFSLFRLAKIHA